MTAEEIRNLSDEDLDKKAEELIDEIFNTRIQFATQQNTNVAKIRSLKKDYARVLTIKREKTLQAGS